MGEVLTVFNLAIMDCPVRLCGVQWGFTPGDSRAYWAGRDSTRNKIVDHIVAEHPGGAVHVLAQIALREEWWWGLEHVETE